MYGFKITTTQLDRDFVVVALSGEADLSVAPEFTAELMKAVDLNSRFVVLDLGQATFIDSTALRVAMQGRARLEARDGAMSIVCPDARLWKIFEITGLAKLFPRYSTVDDAVEMAKMDDEPAGDGVATAEAIRIDPSEIPATQISPVP